MASERIPASVAKRITFRAIASSDHITPSTGKTIAITISKNGGAFGNPAAGATNATEISSGFYYFDLGTGDTGTAGPLAWRGAGTGIDDVGDVLEVVNANNAGFAALPNAAAGAAGGVPVLDSTLAIATGARLRKNTALAKYTFMMTDSTNHNPATGKTVTVTRSIDGGSFAGGTIGSVTEIAYGLYYVDLPAADLNGNVVTLRMTASGCDDLAVTHLMEP